MKKSFRTELDITGRFPSIHHGKPIFLIGSCFSDNMGGLLNRYRFNTCLNPFGISYNPVSISKQLMRIVNDEDFHEEDFISCNGGWNSFDLHGSFLSLTPEEAQKKANESKNSARKVLSEASHLIITLGTAWVYRLISSGEIVNNCHKIRSDEFEKELLSVDQVSTSLEDALRSVKALNPSLEIVLTLSPVRHLKDGFQENSISKSILRLAIEQMVNGELAHYFPAYEIMMDDLRDYRFYDQDLVHPSNEAIEYIWTKFCRAIISEKSREWMEDIEKLNRALEHRPFNPELKEHQMFLQSTLTLATELYSKHQLPGLEANIRELKEKLA